MRPLREDSVPILDPVLDEVIGEASLADQQNETILTLPPSAYSDTAPNRLIGTYLAGKYRILQKIGEGGMGAVYTANQEPIDRKVAVKVLLSSLAHDEVAVRRFEQEAKAISRMRHPNTVTIYDFGKTAAGELYIVMEYLEGETLAELIRRERQVAPDRAARIIRQACASLSEAHAAGIVHRDLKPDNIFLTALGGEPDWVKVLDFGLAKLADNETTAQLTQRGKVFGTPRYMSPEQAQGL
ncbi:MAG: serine/threonine protein kinase, partial [Myxococcales bacterium]|nr:serine/threonine protein kinase [Myxococcales bacterium]